ncbi:hypothetical protein ELH99_29780 (plasmid) [Rhizobium leguminosarum]|nr:hypothetical protein ELH99_29780 [Rhizobium leguminosarum]TAY28284.1 hypothetical protein ELH89_26330 [Rhizobium leguminosarum]
MRRRHQRHSTVDDFRQNLDPLQVTLAHRNQSHRQSPTSSNAGSVTFQLCRNRTLQLCGYINRSHNVVYGTTSREVEHGCLHACPKGAAGRKLRRS